MYLYGRSPVVPRNSVKYCFGFFMLSFRYIESGRLWNKLIHNNVCIHVNVESKIRSMIKDRTASEWDSMQAKILRLAII